MAVAIWDHLPGAAELLAERLRRAWRPRESPVGEGPKILGYAACLLDRVDVGERVVDGVRCN